MLLVLLFTCAFELHLAMVLKDCIIENLWRIADGYAWLQVDYLQQKNHELENELDRVKSRVLSTAEVDARNYELTKELQDVDLMAQKLQMEKDKVIRVADLEIGQTKVSTYINYSLVTDADEYS